MKYELARVPNTDLLTTPEGIRVEVGQVWRDLDKRMWHGKRQRQCHVMAVDAVKGKVRMCRDPYSDRGTWVSVRRMYRHSSGWELVR